MLTLRELYRMMAAAGNAPFWGLGLVFGGLITLSPWIEARYGISTHPLLPLAAVVFAVRMVLERAPDKRVEALSSTLFGLVYVSLLLQYLVRIVTPVDGSPVGADGRLVFCLWVVAVAKFCDVGALLTGLAIGRHPMAPLTSPKKTWEGAIGGVLVSMGVGALVAWLGRSVLPAFPDARLGGAPGRASRRRRDRVRPRRVGDQAAGRAEGLRRRGARASAGSST